MSKIFMYCGDMDPENHHIYYTTASKEELIKVITREVELRKYYNEYKKDWNDYRVALEERNNKSKLEWLRGKLSQIPKHKSRSKMRTYAEVQQGKSVTYKQKAEEYDLEYCMLIADHYYEIDTNNKRVKVNLLDGYVTEENTFPDYNEEYPMLECHHDEDPTFNNLEDLYIQVVTLDYKRDIRTEGGNAAEWIPFKELNH